MARKSKFSDAQVIAAIKEVEPGTTAKDVARKMGVSYETFNRWKAKYGEMTMPRMTHDYMTNRWS